MKTRQISKITEDLKALSPDAAQTVASIAYQLRSVRLTATPHDRAFARLLRDIANGDGDDLRMAYIESAR